MKYTDLGLKIDKSTSKVKVGDKDVEVLNYLPMEDKIDLIQIALQKSEEDGIYNVYTYEHNFVFRAGVKYTL